eukprot:1643225-Pleurochrysis_carterae.AAC.1
MREAPRTAAVTRPEATRSAGRRLREQGQRARLGVSKWGGEEVEGSKGSEEPESCRSRGEEGERTRPAEEKMKRSSDC